MMLELRGWTTYDKMAIKTPKYTWKCILTHNTFWMVEEGKQPNWFHRKMQQLCFGFKWEKIDG
jgi:hypothetical protein